MTVRLERTFPPAVERDLLELSKLLGGAHGDWLAFLSRTNGAVPEPNSFEVGSDNASGVTALLGTREVLEARAKLEERLPSMMLAIAEDDCGNHVCLGLEGDGGVLFWDHELETFVELAPSFDAFMNGLQPFDPDSIELESGQVLEAWIDPSLLPRK